MENRIVHYHLPGLFEFHEFYRVFIPLYQKHSDWFYEGCDIGSIYGAPADCLWAGGRISSGNQRPEVIASDMEKWGLSSRLTLSNSLLCEEHLKDEKCNHLLTVFAQKGNGVIVHSDLLKDYILKNYPIYELTSSTTKVLTDFTDFRKELDKEEFGFVVPDFRLNKCLNELNTLTDKEKDKVEFLINECCYIGCNKRKECYENVSRRILDENTPEHRCNAPYGNEGYVFSRAKKNPSFISLDDIRNIYLPMGFTNFKIEGRGLGSALLLEILLYYMAKPEYTLNIRECIYLDNTLDLF